MPPHLGGHYDPHPEWGFEAREDEFLGLLRRHRVGLVCCAAGDGHPADRGSLFHAVQIAVAEDGTVSGKVLQAFEPEPGRARIRF